MIAARHTSPDGLLTLLVDEEDGDWTVGFEGSDWHTHGDLLTAYGERSPELAIDAFVRDLVEGRWVIALLRRDNIIFDIWVTDDPVSEREEGIEFRYWDGRPFTVTEVPGRPVE